MNRIYTVCIIVLTLAISFAFIVATLESLGVINAVPVHYQYGP